MLLIEDNEYGDGDAAALQGQHNQYEKNVGCGLLKQHRRLGSLLLLKGS